MIPRTTQSVATFFTGRYPWEHGVEEIGERLADEETTLAETLSAAGYDTAGISANSARGLRLTTKRPSRNKNESCAPRA